MKRRYSPEARRAHLAHMRAKYGMYIKDRPDLGSEHFPVYEIGVREVATLPTLPVDEVVRQGEALIENYKQGFLTMLELGQSLNELFAREQPKPDPKPEEDDDGLPLPAPKHDECCQCHLCWAASLTPPSPPWEAPENQPPAGVAQWEWELGKTDPAQNICGYCGAPYYPGNAVYCASCTPREGGAA